MPDFNVVRDHVRQRMVSELDSRLYYHSVAHTFDDVLPAVQRIALMLNLDSVSVLLLKTAAVFHDLGFIETNAGHEAASVKLAQAILPDFGYDDAQIDQIAGMIMATRLPQSPTTLLEEILADADLDVLGRKDFVTRNPDLRKELTAFGAVISDIDWYGGQFRFVSSHDYFTVAKTIRDEQKQENVQWLADRLASVQSE